MHIVQMLLVESYTHQDAVRTVDNFITGWEGHWSDYHEVGGRWKGIFGEMNPDVICYGDDPELFEKFLAEFIDARVKNLKRDFEQIKDLDLESFIDSYDPNTSNLETGMKGYYIRKIGSVISDHWTFDSAFYDIEANDAGLTYFRERVAKTPKQQFAVAVDFHF